MFVFFADAFSPDYLATAVFVDDVDKLFDSFNSVKHGLWFQLRLCGGWSVVLVFVTVQKASSATAFCIN